MTLQTFEVLKQIAVKKAEKEKSGEKKNDRIINDLLAARAVECPAIGNKPLI